ncbi:MAG: YqhA family protein [Methylocella sp.]
MGLAVSLLLLLGKFALGTVELARQTATEDANKLITGTLSLVDLPLMGNLLVMVMFAGYENFVSRFGEVTKRNRPDWMGKVGFGALKLKPMTSIVALAAIHMREDFMHVAEIENRELGWSVGILLAFVVSGLLLAPMDRLGGSGH